MTCPLCRSELYPWASVPPSPGDPAPAPPLAAGPGDDRVLVRCESCGVALEQGRELDLTAEWAAICRAGDDGAHVIAIPNRASLQASIGREGWAAIDQAPGRLLLTRRSLELLAERTGHEVEEPGFPPVGRNQGWMWQTLMNGLTLHPNFAREARAGRLRPGTGRGRAAFVVDAVATLLAAPLVALVSFPLEVVAALLGRGGELRSRVRTG